MALAMQISIPNAFDLYQDSLWDSDAVKGELFGLYQFVQEGAEAVLVCMPGEGISFSSTPSRMAL